MKAPCMAEKHDSEEWPRLEDNLWSKGEENKRLVQLYELTASVISFLNVFNNKTEQQTDGADADSSLLPYIFVLLDYTSA